MPKGKDLRVQQTEQMIRMALVHLMETKPVEKITVTELCKKANINRNTFYAHYYRPADVLEQIFDNWEIDIHLFDYFDDPYAITQKYVQLLVDHPDLLKLMKSTDLMHNQLFRHLLSTFQSHTIATWQQLRPDLTKEELTKRYLYAEGGSLALIVDWVEHDMEQSSTSLANTLLAYAMNFCEDIWYNEDGTKRTIPK